MKKSYSALIVILVLSMFYFSCNKDNPVTYSSPQTYVVTNKYKRSTNKGIPSMDTLTIGDSGSMLSLSFTLDTILAIDGTQKLDVVLIHENITDTLLKSFSNPSNPSYNFMGCICSDSAAGYFPQGLSEYSGTYKPYSPLSVFNGKTLNGPWYLIFNYPASNKTGVIKSWSITITYNAQYPSGSHIVPLALNNRWIYEIDTGSSYFKSDSINIVGTSVVHGQQVYWWKWQSQSVIWYERDESDGMWQYGCNQDTTSQTQLPHLLIKYPINSGDKYYTNHWMNNYDTVTCTSTNKTFNNLTGCIEYFEQSTYKKDSYNEFNHNLFDNSSPNTVISFYSYFKPEIGYIGSIQTSSVGGNTITMTTKLINYTLH